MHPLDAPGALWVLSRAGKVPRPPAGGRNLPQETDFLRKAGNGPTFLFRITKDFASAEATRGLSDRPLDPFGAPLSVGAETDQINRFLVEGKGKAFLAFSVLGRVSPLRRRPGGFPIAPWTPSGNFYLRQSPTHRLFLCILAKKYRNNKPTSPAPFLALLWQRYRHSRHPPVMSWGNKKRIEKKKIIFCQKPLYKLHKHAIMKP